MSQENVDVVRKAMTNFVRSGEFGNVLAPDAVVVNAPGSPFTVQGSGPAAIREWVTEINEAFEEWEFRPDEMLDGTGNKVVLLNRAWGRGGGTGLEVEMELNVVYSVIARKIARVEGYRTRE